MAYSLNPKDLREELKTYKQPVYVATTQPAQQTVAPASTSQYRKVKRADGGTDFYNGNQKTTIEEFSKATGNNVDAVRSQLAAGGSKFDQDILTKQYFETKDPEVIQFNRLGVDQQRQRIAQLRDAASRKSFNTVEDAKNQRWASEQLANVEKFGTKKEGNLLTLAQDFVGGLAAPGAQIVNTVTDSSQQTLRHKALNELAKQGMSEEDYNSALRSIYQNSVDTKFDYNDQGKLVKGQLNPLEFAGKFSREAADAGLTYMPLGAGYKSVAGLALKDAAPTIAKNVFKEGTAYTVANTANDVLQGREITPGSLLINAATSYGGAALGAGTALAKPGFKAAGDTVATGAKNVARAVENVNPQLAQINETLDNYKRAFDVETNPVRREQINQGIAQLNTQRRRILERGSIQVPGGKDPMAAVREEMQKSGIDGIEAAKKLGIEKEYEAAIRAEYTQAFKENNAPILPGGKVQAPQVTKTPTQAATQKTAFEADLEAAGLTPTRSSEATLARQQQLGQQVASKTEQPLLLEQGTLGIKGSVETPSSAQIISQEPLQLTPGQAKQRFRKLNREGTPFEIINNLDKNGKAKKTHVIDAKGKIVKGGIEDTPDLDFSQFKDRPALALGRETLERILDSVAGKQAPKIKQYLVDASRKNETSRVKFINAKRAEVKQKIVKDLGIKAGSKRSELVQKFGEGEITLKELKELAPDSWMLIKKGSDYFRSQYDELLDRWNAVRQQYGYEPIPKRKDYFRHFIALDNATSIMGTIKNARDLPTSIAGMTGIFKPNQPFSNAALARTGKKTTYDAVAGFDNYIDSISKQVYHTDTVQRGRGIVKAIRDKAEIDESKANLPNFVSNLDEWTNLVAGKKSAIDRSAEALVGRKVFAFSNAVKNRVSANMIGYNLGSALTAGIPLTQSLATTAKIPAIKGLLGTLVSATKKGALTNIDGVESSFLTRRFPTEAFSRDAIEKAIRAGYAPMKAIDMFSSRSIVSGKYYENIAKGMSRADAMKAADEFAGKVITDRSLGQMPNIFKAQTPGVVTQFMAEVNNQLSFVLKDMPKQFKGNPAKIAWAAAQMAVYAYLYNEMFESITGRRVAVDPIDFVKDMSDPNQSDEQKWDSLQQNILSGVPGSGILFDSGRLPISAAMPDFAALGSAAQSFAEGDLEKAGRQAAKGVAGTAAYLLPPTGGGQAKKMIDQATNEITGYSQTPAGQIRFKTSEDPIERAKGYLFGQYATAPGKEYIKGGTKPLGDNQSEVFKNLPANQQQDYIDLKRGTSDKATSTAIAELTKKNDEIKAKFEASFSPEDYELYSLSKENRKSLVSSGAVTQEKLDQLDKYAKSKKKELGMEVSGGIGETKLDGNSTAYKFLDSKPEMTDDERATWSRSEVAKEYQPMVDQFNAKLPSGLPKLPYTNKTAELLSEFQKDRADNNWSKLELNDKAKDLAINTYKAQLTDNEQFITTLSDADIKTAAQNGQISKEELDRIIAIDDITTKLGGSQMIGNKTRKLLGYGTIASKSSGGGGSGKKRNYKLNAFGDVSGEISGNLRKLVEQATIKGV